MVTIGFYAAFVTAALLAFWRATPARAVAVTLIGGWVWLPSGPYPAVPNMLDFPYWIIGSALPSDMLVSKAWIAPIVALAGSLIVDRGRWGAMRWRWFDMVMAGWCLWPALSDIIRPTSPPGVIASLYLAGSWGAAWLLGRAYLSDRAGRRIFGETLILVTLSLLPFAIVEGLSAVRVHELLIGPHPFARDGAVRYIGYRPQALFEHGNQYGIWVACAATCAIGMALSARPGQSRRTMTVAAMLLVAMTLVSQSGGAMLLMLAGIGGMLLMRIDTRLVRNLVLAAIAGVLLTGAVALAAGGSLRAAALASPVASRAIAVLKASGRGSLAWRAAQDDKLVPLIRRAPILGSGQWDWWRERHTRSWGLPMLILGQYGLIGLLLLAVPMLYALGRQRFPQPMQSSRIVAAALVLMAMADALLNSFIFWPAIPLVAGLAWPTAKRPAEHASSRPD